MFHITDWHMNWIDWLLVSVLLAYALVSLANSLYFKPRDGRRQLALTGFIDLMDQVEHTLLRLREPYTENMQEFMHDVELLHEAIWKNRYNPDPLVVWAVKVSMANAIAELNELDKEIGNDGHAPA